MRDSLNLTYSKDKIVELEKKTAHYFHEWSSSWAQCLLVDHRMNDIQNTKQKHHNQLLLGYHGLSLRTFTQLDLRISDYRPIEHQERNGLLNQMNGVQV